MNEWREVTLGEVADLLVGFAFKSARFTNGENGPRLLRGVNIGQGSLDWSRCARWPEDERAKYQRYELSDGDVVLAMDRPWIEAGLKRARVRSSDLPALLVQRVTRMRGTELVRTSFLHHVVGSRRFSDYIKPIVTGVNVPHISPDQIKAFSFLLPGLPTQDAVCSTLDAIDDLIENNWRRIAVLERMAQAIYREWFVHFRYPGHEDDELVDSPLGLMPTGWEAMRLGAVAETQYGFTDSATQSPEGPQFLRVMDINKRSHISWRDVPHCSPHVPARFRLSRGDVVIARMADPGKTGIVERDIDAVFASYLVRLRPTAPWLHPYYLYFVVSSASYQEFVLGASTGTTRKSISAKVMEEGLILQPTSEIVSAFVEAVVPARDGLTAVAETSERLESIRNLLLPRLVMGAIDGSSLDLDAVLDETAA